jgi:glycerol kinase
LKQTDRKGTYIKYVHMLVEQHLSSSNYTEAGLTVLLHAELLNWSDELLPEQGDFPSELSRQRKVSHIYHFTIHIYSKMHRFAGKIAKDGHRIFGQGKNVGEGNRTRKRIKNSIRGSYIRLSKVGRYFGMQTI